MATKVTLLTTQFAKHLDEWDAADMDGNKKRVNAVLAKKMVVAKVTKVEPASGGKAATLTVDGDDPSGVKNAFK